MGKYVLIYSGGTQPESEEDGQRVMAAWQDWLGGMGEAAVDWGAPFGASAPVNATSGLTGYSIIAADSLDEAVEKAKGCPIFASGGGVEVYETIEM